MIGRRRFLVLASSAAIAAVALPKLVLAEGPAYVSWPVDYGQNWHEDFDTRNLIFKAEWRVYNDQARYMDERATEYGLGFIITKADAVDQAESARRTVQTFNRVLEHVRRMHGFPEQMIHWAVRAPHSRVRWRRTIAGGFQPYWTHYGSDEPTLVGFAYPATV